MVAFKFKSKFTLVPSHPTRTRCIARKSVVSDPHDDPNFDLLILEVVDKN